MEVSAAVVVVVVVVAVVVINSGRIQNNKVSKAAVRVR